MDKLYICTQCNAEYDAPGVCEMCDIELIMESEDRDKGEQEQEEGDRFGEFADEEDEMKEEFDEKEEDELPREEPYSEKNDDEEENY